MAKSGATNIQAQNLLSRDFGSVVYTPPATWYIGASTTLINADGTGKTEPSDPSYARVTVSNNTASWEDIPADVGRRNLINLEFPVATTAWGTITYIFFADALTGGTIRYYAELINPKVVGVDDVLRVDAGNLQIKILPTV